MDFSNFLQAIWSSCLLHMLLKFASKIGLVPPLPAFLQLFIFSVALCFTVLGLKSIVEFIFSFYLCGVCFNHILDPDLQGYSSSEENVSPELKEIKKLGSKVRRLNTELGEISPTNGTCEEGTSLCDEPVDLGTILSMNDISNTLISFGGVVGCCRLATTCISHRATCYQAHEAWNFLYQHRFSRLCSITSLEKMQQLTFRRTYYKKSLLQLRRVGSLPTDLKRPEFRAQLAQELRTPSSIKKRQTLADWVGLCQHRHLCNKRVEVICTYEGCNKALCTNHAKRAQRLWRGAPGAIFARCSYCFASVCERHSCPENGQPRLKIWSCGSCGVGCCNVCFTEMMFNARLDPPNENARCYRCSDNLCRCCAIPYEELSANAYLCSTCEEKYLAPKNGPEEFWVRDDDLDVNYSSNVSGFQDITQTDLNRSRVQNRHTDDALSQQALLSLLVDVLDAKSDV